MWRREGQTVFVTNQFGDLVIGLLERRGVFREIGAATRSIGEGVEPSVGLGEGLLGLVNLLPGSFFAVTKRSVHGHGENADVRGLEAGNQRLLDLIGRSVHAGGNQDDGFFARDASQPVENGAQAAGQVQVTVAQGELDGV